MAAQDTRRLRVVVTGDSGDAQQALEQVGQASEQTESKLVTLTRALGAWAARGAVAFGAVAVAAGTMGIQTAAQLEQVEVGFTTMLGSAEKAQKFMKQLQQFAAATPFEFTELVGSAQRFLAMGFAAKDVIPMLTAVGDAVAAMGGSAESVDSVTRALGQMQAKGKVSGEELMQLTEQGIPALKILADQYGVSTMEMSKMIEKGEVLSNKAIPLLIKGLKDGTENVKGFGGMMENQSATLQGKWSTLMDNLRMGLGNLAYKFLPQAKKAVEITSKAIGDFFAGLSGKGKAAGFSGTVNEIGLGFRAMIAAFKEGDVTSDGIVGKFETLGVAAKKVVDAFNATKDATITVINWMREHDKVTAALTITMGALLAVTKAHTIFMTVNAAGGLIAMAKNLSLVASVTKVVTAVQWAYNGATAAAAYLQIAGYLGAVAVGQKAVALGTKIATAAQWLWNAALTANPIGIVIAAVAALVAAIVLLWKNNEGFRNFVLNVLWPAIKKAWEAILTAGKAVVNALVTAWQWLSSNIMKVWNAIVGFLTPIINVIVSILSPIFSVIGKIASFMLTFYNNVWKMVWILIQIAVKVFMEYMKVVWAGLQVVFRGIGNLVMWLYNNIFKPQFELIKIVIGAVVSFIQTYVVPAIQKGWDNMKASLTALKNFFVAAWNIVRGHIQWVIDNIVGPIIGKLKTAFNALKTFFNIFLTWWNSFYDGMSKKVNAVWDGIVKAFNKGKEGVKKAWDSLVAISKKPVNFVINDIYNNRILPMWNRLAEKFGIKTRLDKLPAFARGGIVGSGYGAKDDQLALLTRGEGILTTREMRKLGGPKGFQEFRKSLAMYNKGGVVGGDGKGWFGSMMDKTKDLIQGLAGPVIRPLVNAAKTFVNGSLGSGGFSGLMKSGATSLLDKLLGWVTGKDKEMPSMGAGGRMGMGYRAMQALIARAFPGLRMISGLRPGATTVTGNRSYHAMGRAVDYPANAGLARWIFQTFGKTAREIITPWHQYNVHNGKPHRYTGAVWNTHNFAGGNPHVHWAMDGISTVQPGWFSGYNGTGKPETLVNSDLLDGAGMHIDNVNIYIQGSADPKATARQVRDEFIKLSKRNGGRSGLPTS